VNYLETLGNELVAAGIPGGRRARILAEFADHLESDPNARLGAPRDLARQFADELGTTLARRAAFVALAGLAVAAVLFAVGFLSAQDRVFVSASSAEPLLGRVGAWVTVVGGQVALVAGLLAALRAFRLRADGVVSRAEAVTIVRRASVGVGAGVVTMVGFGLSALALRHHTPSWWPVLALGLAGGGIVVLLAITPVLASAARLRPLAAGSAGDLDEDLGPLMPAPLRARPWRFALAVALAVAVLIAVAGVVQSDPFDGALRGLADGAACLAGFGLLGRYLSLRA
jgi:hypothetical protein